MTQLYRDTHRRGSPLSLLFSTLNVAHVSSFLRSLSLSLCLFVSFLLLAFAFRRPESNVSPSDSLFSSWYAIQVISWIIKNRRQWRVLDFSEAPDDEISPSNYSLPIGIFKHRAQTAREKQFLRVSMFPWSMRVLVDQWKKRKIYNRWGCIRVSSLVLSKVRQHAIHDRNANEECPDSPIIALITLFPVDR